MREVFVVYNSQARSKGMAVHVIFTNAAGFINTFANSVGLERWYCFVFVVKFAHTTGTRLRILRSGLCRDCKEVEAKFFAQ